MVFTCYYGSSLLVAYFGAKLKTWEKADAFRYCLVFS